MICYLCRIHIKKMDFSEMFDFIWTTCLMLFMGSIIFAIVFILTLITKVGEENMSFTYFEIVWRYVFALIVTLWILVKDWNLSHDYYNYELHFTNWIRQYPPPS